jgi:hypothetical protein
LGDSISVLVALFVRDAAELGRPVQPFRLQIYTVPVASTGSWRLGPDRLLASDGALRDPETLRPYIRSLA